MANPTTVTLVAATAQNATLDGVWAKVEVLPLAANQVVFAVSAPATATQGTASEWACLPYDFTQVPVQSQNGTTTVVSLISATAGQVQIRPVGDTE